MGIETQVEEKPRKGGLRTMPFIIVNEAFERVASYGLQFNMLIYLMTYYNMSTATGTTILGLWGALSSGLALVGAIIADSYWGRFRAVAFGSISTLIPRGLSPVTRMGIGLIASCMSIALSAITESIRRQKAIEEGHEDDTNALVNMSAMWFVPQYALLGVAEAAHAVGQIEFLYALLPKSMSSIASSMYTVGTAVSSLIGSIMVSGVNWLSSSGGKTSWLSSNINKGHLDYYFWLLTFLNLLNFFYFLVICWLYGSGNNGSSRSPHVAEDKECDYRFLPES